MSDVILGCDPLKVTTFQEFPLGTTSGDPRGGAFSNNKLKYVQASNAIVGSEAVAGADSVMVDNAQTDALKPGRVTPIAGVTDIVEGAAQISIPDENFGWITIEGRVNNCKVTDAGAAEGAALGASATAGTLVAITAAGAPTQAELIAAIRYAGGRRAFAVVDVGTNLWDIYLRG